MKGKIKIILILALVPLLIYGCAGSIAPASFIKPEMDLSLIRRVAVLRLDNFTRERMAHKKVRRILISEILATGAFEMVDPGLVNREMARLGSQVAAGMKVEEVKALGKRLDAQALIMGAVIEYGQVRSGAVSAPIVSLSLRMVETERGSIIWSCTVNQGGISWGTRLLGVSRDTISETTVKAVRKALNTLFR